MEIHVRIKNQQYGPFSIEEIRKQLANGRLQPVDEAWHDGLPDWVTVREVLAVSEPMKVDIKSQNKPNLTPVYDKCPACNAPIQPTDEVCFRCTFQLDQVGKGRKRRARPPGTGMTVFGCAAGIIFFIAEEGSQMGDPWGALCVGSMFFLIACGGAYKLGWIDP